MGGISKEPKASKIEIFVDTSAWLAFFASFDVNHQKAVDFLRQKKAVFITSDYVFAELIATSKRLVSFRQLIKIGEGVLRMTKRFLPQDEEIRKLSWKRYKKTFSQKVSFVDWTNFVLMKKYKIDKIFAFDRHFGKMGLEVMP